MIRRVFGDVSLAVMEMYYMKYDLLKREMMTPFASAIHRNQDRQLQLQELRICARALVNFIGMNTLYIGADVNAKLVRLEALMS